MLIKENQLDEEIDFELIKKVMDTEDPEAIIEVGKYTTIRILTAMNRYIYYKRNGHLPYSSSHISRTPSA